MLNTTTMTIEEIKKRVKLWTGMKTTMKTWIYKQIYDFCVERKRPLPKFLRRKIYVKALNIFRNGTLINHKANRIIEGGYMCPCIYRAIVEVTGRYATYIYFLPEFSRIEFCKYLRYKAAAPVDIIEYPLKGTAIWIPHNPEGYYLRENYLMECAFKCGYHL